MTLSPRVLAFRQQMIQQLPRAPNNRASLIALGAMPTHRLILAFMTWRMRLVPAKPRTVSRWSGGLSPIQFQLIRPRLLPLLAKVEAGKDLTPHLSDLVNTKGVVLPGSALEARGQDIDGVLIRNGLHHFHVGTPGPKNRKGRSGPLVFAEVLSDEFRIVAVSDHRAFDRSEPEHMRFFQLCRAYIEKDIPPGQGYMANPVMSSGHSLNVVMFSDRCDDEIQRLDPLLDDPDFIASLYAEQKGEAAIPMPAKPDIAWHFEDLAFGLLDRATGVFFCTLPYFRR